MGWAFELALGNGMGIGEIFLDVGRWALGRRNQYWVNTGSAQIPSKLDPSGLQYEKRTRPDGMTQFAWKNGKCMAWDVTCVDTLAKSHIRKTTSVAGAAAEHAERLKAEKYVGLSGQYEFHPIGLV